MDTTTREALVAFQRLRTALAVVALDPARRARATDFTAPLQVLAEEANAKMTAAGFLDASGPTVTTQEIEALIRQAGLTAL
ncbi:hypothetical protein F7Q99_40155 [Streptomyces kaniharaensis]|uniref:Uncharacterized protein n=1 Tax=Streptomyces kaniharaensis TaxID=212423 RepID=A0A6N7L2X3_9ACTN|nr:hypothetical protein [Streptomyces kaniharaensis]MQS17991.1 hypothetical protein [Streptomyces kaniharaensis]MQS18074.1 hypothetical protein [Streptomyces kaniharaensis]MQS18081.1 hypothetical protein [Streptomyces kaniharaensis]MQS18162.1 hypothetical protein [Streptomyces kaniharaensis]MQS18169.1 hypothetical protein [Streptomyces kaniharaensis]